MKKFLFFIGFILFVSSEFFAAYFLLPFPYSQENTHIGIAYFLNEYLWFFRAVSILCILPFFWYEFKPALWYTKTIVLLFTLIAFFVHYMCSHEMRAGAMFKDMHRVEFFTPKTSTYFPNQLVIGVSVNGEHKAYPVEIIGYHHQVNDVIGGKNILVTYCTVCRTGRVYNPVIEGQPTTFTLIGMDSYNALFRDNTTGSWWRQATGECVAGPMKGSSMNEIPSEQLTLAEWMQKHPETKILAPDNMFRKDYDDLKEYDEGTMKSSLEGRDFSSGKMKSWVVGIVVGKKHYMVDWNHLTKNKVVNNEDFVLVQYSEGLNFAAFAPKGKSFVYDEASKALSDNESLSKWDLNGFCFEGKHKGEQLNRVAAYQEFRHSWLAFHPGTIEIK